MATNTSGTIAGSLMLNPLLREALAAVPGYHPQDGHSEIARLQGGSVNLTYRVRTAAGSFAVRLSPSTDAWLTTDRSVERELHSRAAAAGIAPRIVQADASDRWIITELVEGRGWVADDFADADCLTRLGLTLRHLHGLPAPNCGRFDLLQALDGYVRRIHSPDSQLESLVGQARVVWNSSGAGGRSPAILHHDLSAANMIDSTRGLVLIDWECAAVSDPLLDVACILSYYERARPHARLLLRTAGLGEVPLAQLAGSLWLFDLHTLLWYRERRQRLTPTEAERLAEEHLRNRVSQGVQPVCP